MKKNIAFLLILLFFININVYAQNQDVQAKYETTYNVELYKGILNNNEIEIEIDKYNLFFSSKLKNIEVVIIKTEKEANEYISQFTQNEENYYIGFFADGKKINSGNVQLSIENDEKVLHVYDKNGNLIDKSTTKINLDSNDYYFTIEEKELIKSNRYILTDINNLASDMEEFETNSDSKIKVYNSKKEEVPNINVLGTGYKVVIINNKTKNEYDIVVRGDTTGDGKISLNDVTRLYHYYKNIENMSEPFVLAGDVASNEIINLNDITKIYHYYKGIISDF